MKYVNIVNGPSNASVIIQGCMRMPALSKEEAAKVIRTAYDAGIKREDIIIQSKCGLCFDRNEFDWTKENILSSVDDSLRRLKIDYLDTLLLHRPDVLYDPEDDSPAHQCIDEISESLADLCVISECGNENACDRTCSFKSPEDCA